MESPIAKVGEYEIPLTSILGVQRHRPGRLARLWYRMRRRVPPTEYDLYLAGGIILRLNEEEKAALDHERETHQAVMQVYGMFASWQQSHGGR